MDNIVLRKAGTGLAQLAFVVLLTVAASRGFGGQVAVVGHFTDGFGSISDSVPKQIRAISEMVHAGFVAGKWGAHYDMQKGEKPVLVYVARVGLFLFGTKKPCRWINSSWDWLIFTSPFDRLADVSPSQCSEAVVSGRSTLPYGFIMVQRELDRAKVFSAYRIFNVRTDKAFSESQLAIDSNPGQLGFDRLLEITLQNANDHSLRQLGRLIVHEGAHLFGQDSLTMPLYGSCRTPSNPEAISCRAHLVDQSQIRSPEDARDHTLSISREICASADLVRCIYGVRCPARDNPDLSSTEITTESKRRIVSSLLKEIVESIEERTLGRTQAIESYWYLLEGVPTFLEKTFMTNLEFVSLIESQCLRRQIISRYLSDLHHTYVGASLIAGFRYCMPTAEIVEHVASFSDEGVWSRLGVPWFSTLIGNVREKNCN